MGVTTIGEALAEQMAGRLREYRGIVAAAARGEPVSGADASTAERHLRSFGLPAYAFRRDVRAMAGADTARGYRRAELELNHPHLFAEPSAWVRERVEAARRRVRK